MKMAHHRINDDRYQRPRLFRIPSLMSNASAGRGESVGHGQGDARARSLLDKCGTKRCVDDGFERFVVGTEGVHARFSKHALYTDRHIPPLAEEFRLFQADAFGELMLDFKKDINEAIRQKGQKIYDLLKFRLYPS